MIAKNIVQEKIMTANENLADLFAESEKQAVHAGSLVKAKVIYIGSDLVVLNTGLKF